MDWYDKEKWDEQFVTMCKKAEPFLKGFDEPKNAVLYIDKNLKQHNLIQVRRPLLFQP